MATRIQLRRDTSANWTSADPVLSQWEIWLETDSLKIKIWDGESLRSELNYFAGAWWATTFLELTDVPDNYTDQEWKVVKVNATADWLEFGEATGWMENPMTTAWDIIYGGNSGTPTRLAKWDDGEVLKLVSGVPSWEADAGWMTDPMTTRWDIIYRDASAPARLAKGSEWQVLTMGANDPAWATPFSQTTQTLTDWANVSWNTSSWSCWILTLGWDWALSNMTNAVAWRTYTLIVKQDWTGTRLLTYWNQYYFPWNTKPVLSSTANAVDILQFFAESSTVFHLVNFISDSK